MTACRIAAARKASSEFKKCVCVLGLQSRKQTHADAFVVICCPFFLLVIHIFLWKEPGERSRFNTHKQVLAAERDFTSHNRIHLWKLIGIIKQKMQPSGLIHVREWKHLLQLLSSWLGASHILRSDTLQCLWSVSGFCWLQVNKTNRMSSVAWSSHDFEESVP